VVTPADYATPLSPHELAARFEALRPPRRPVIPLLFEQDPGRVRTFSCSACDLHLDYSKTGMTAADRGGLFDLMHESGAGALFAAALNGEPVNTTEGRAVLHTALRAGGETAVRVGGEDVMPEVRAVLERMKSLCEAIRGGTWRGSTGETITDVVNVGIGGSDLGPRMAVTALDAYADGPRLHFVANVDGAEIVRVLRDLDPARTLFLIASKSFTTQETMTNARTARAWITESLGARADVAKHFIALSTNEAAVSEFGIAPETMLRFWDWVGGRYSLWSAIGMPVALALGFEGFERLLAGARAMDAHVAEAPPEDNLAWCLAATGLWHRNVLGYTSRAVVPYAADLRLLPAHLQQVDMESNGKSVRRDGLPVGVPTAPVLWGTEGTNAQHSYFQMLHQGTEEVPVEFIGVARPARTAPGHNRLLLANMLAQARALMLGRSREAAERLLLEKGRSAEDAARLAPFQAFHGNRPSLSLLMKTLTPETLGALVALYEHRIFLEAAVWGINAFDQFGVELGKVLAKQLLDGDHGDLDASTEALMAQLSDWGGESF